MSRAVTTLTPDEAVKLGGYVDRVGEKAALHELGLCDATVARAIAQLPIQRSTAALIRMRLESGKLGVTPDA